MQPKRSFSQRTVEEQAPLPYDLDAPSRGSGTHRQGFGWVRGGVLLSLMILVWSAFSACEKECPQCSRCEPAVTDAGICNNKPAEPCRCKEPTSCLNDGGVQERVVVPPEVRGEQKPEANQPDSPAPSAACGPPTATFYAPLPTKAFDASLRGEIGRCEELGVRSKASLALDPLFTVSQGSPSNGFRILRIQYRTQAPAGTLRSASALVYIPMTDQGQCVSQAPIAVVNHGTSGMGSICAPSHAPALSVEYMILPLVGRGYIVVAPDYIGQGVPSALGHPYLVSEPTAFAVLDAIRAVGRLSAEGPWKGCASSQAVLLGHSQGGHAVLVAAQRFASDLPSIKHIATISYAPAFGAESLWLGPFNGTFATTAGTAYLLMHLISSTRYYKGPAFDTWLTPQAAKTIPGLLDTFCFGEFTRLLQTSFPTLNTIFQPSFLAASVACQGGKGDCSKFQPWREYIAKSLAGNFTTKTPTLLVQGSQDVLVTAPTVRCLQDRLQKQGSPTYACVEPSATHANIVGLSWRGVLSWLDNIRQNASPSPPPCTSTQLPACP